MKKQDTKDCINGCLSKLHGWADTGEAMEELKEAAFEALLLHPGCGLGEWTRTLFEAYRAEITDVFGTDTKDASAGLAALWKTPYRDGGSARTLTFERWAETFKDETAVRLYLASIEPVKRE